MEGEDSFRLSDGPSTSDAFFIWWRPRTIGAQTWATHFLGDIIPGSVMMTDSMACGWDSTHFDQITSLTRQVAQMSFFIRRLGRDLIKAYVCHPDGLGFGSTFGPSAAGSMRRALRHFIART